MTVRELALKTIEVLEADGWCQGAFTDSQGRHCLFGATGRASSDLDSYRSNRQRNQLHQAIAANLGISVFDLMDWNDNQAKDADQVISVVRAAIEGIEE